MKLAQLISQTGEQEAVIQTLCNLMSADRTTIFLLKEINDNVAKSTLKIIDKYKKGMPLAYLLGYSFFYNRKFFVNKNVLVPRPDTEILVECAEKKIIADTVINKNKKIYKILDLCCGSGAIGISIACLCEWLTKKDENSKFNVTVSDISHNALLVTATNAQLHNVDLEFIQSDLLTDINACYDLILCNPPYIRTKDIGVEDKRILQEPKLALDGGIDGLYYYRKILSNVKNNLSVGGTIMFEIGFDQAEEIISLANINGFSEIKTFKDLANHDRVITMRL